MLLMGYSNYRKPFLLTMIKTLGKCFRIGNTMIHL